METSFFENTPKRKNKQGVSNFKRAFIKFYLARVIYNCKLCVVRDILSAHWSVIRVRLVHGFTCDSTLACNLSGKALWNIRSMFKECHLNTLRVLYLIKRAIGIIPIHWICMFPPHIAENIFSNQLQTRAIRWVTVLLWT